MAESGYENPGYEPQDDDDDEGDDAGNATTPFVPTSASTPGPSSEEIPMKTMQKEKSGLPDTSQVETYFSGRRDVSTEEIERRLRALTNPATGLLHITKIDPSENLLSEEDKAKEVQRVRALIKARYPNAKIDKLVITFSNKTTMDVVVLGRKGGETKIALDDGSSFRKDFLNITFVQKILGPSTETIIIQNTAVIKKKSNVTKRKPRE